MIKLTSHSPVKKRHARGDDIEQVVEHTTSDVQVEHDVTEGLRASQSFLHHKMIKLTSRLPVKDSLDDDIEQVVEHTMSDVQVEHGVWEGLRAEGVASDVT